MILKTNRKGQWHLLPRTKHHQRRNTPCRWTAYRARTRSAELIRRSKWSGVVTGVTVSLHSSRWSSSGAGLRRMTTRRMIWTIRTRSSNKSRGLRRRGTRITRRIILCLPNRIKVAFPMNLTKMTRSIRLTRMNTNKTKVNWQQSTNHCKSTTGSTLKKFSAFKLNCRKQCHLTFRWRT